MTPSDFDFDAMMALAAKDPEAFERKRLELLQQEVAKAPASQQASLNALVQTLTQDTPENATGLERAVHAHNLMISSLTKLTNQWSELTARAQPSSKTAAQATDMLQRFTTLQVAPSGTP